MTHCQFYKDAISKSGSLWLRLCGSRPWQILIVSRTLCLIEIYKLLWMFYARLPLDEKLFERDLQAALQLSKQSTEDEKDVKTGLLKSGIVIFLFVMCIVLLSSSTKIVSIYIDDKKNINCDYQNTYGLRMVMKQVLGAERYLCSSYEWQKWQCQGMWF